MELWVAHRVDNEEGYSYHTRLYRVQIDIRCFRAQDGLDLDP